MWELGRRAKDAFFLSVGISKGVVWVSLSSLRVEPPWAGVPLSVHQDTAREGKVEMICLAKEEKQSKQTKPSLEVGREHCRVCWLSMWPHVHEGRLLEF